MTATETGLFSAPAAGGCADWPDRPLKHGTLTVTGSKPETR